MTAINSDIYTLGKLHYFDGLPVTAMDTAANDDKISWLCGWLDAKLEHAIIRRKARSLNEKRAAI